MYTTTCGEQLVAQCRGELCGSSVRTSRAGGGLQREGSVCTYTLIHATQQKLTELHEAMKLPSKHKRQKKEAEDCGIRGGREKFQQEECVNWGFLFRESGEIV